MGRVHTRRKRLGHQGAEDYTDPAPDGAQKQIGPNYYKRGLNDKIFIWRDEWLRCLTVTDKEFDKASDIEIKTSLSKINANLLSRMGGE